MDADVVAGTVVIINAGVIVRIVIAVDAEAVLHVVFQRLS